jgi:hypothetical protein
MIELYSTLESRTIAAMMSRGHVPDYGERVTPLNGRTVTRFTCRECSMQADSNERPLPNQVDIAGEAVALNCR